MTNNIVFDANRNKMKDTIVINLFAGPGAGKSTGAAYIFAALKMKGIDCELVTEFAKDKVWEQSDPLLFKSQLYILGEQSWRMARCNGKVQVIVTDSPLILQTLYCNTEEPWYEDIENVIKKEFNKYNNLSYFIIRRKEYNPNGRNQTEQQAVELDNTLINMLEKFDIPYSVIYGDRDGYDAIVDKVIKMFWDKEEG